MRAEAIASVGLAASASSISASSWGSSNPVHQRAAGHSPAGAPARLREAASAPGAVSCAGGTTRLPGDAQAASASTRIVESRPRIAL